MKADRADVIAYRVAAQQLDRSARTVRGLAVLDIGVQDAAGEQARLAFDARLSTTPPAEPFGPGKALAQAWTLRGAPYVHPRGRLADVAAALYPLSERDAQTRLNENGASVKRAGVDAAEQFDLAVDAMRRSVTKATSKGAASTAATKLLPEPMRRACRSCGTSHLSDSAMRAAALAAGLELQPGTSPPVLQRWSGSTVTSGPDLAALRKLIIGYLTVLGPATSAHVADYLGARRADIDEIWPDDLDEVVVGRRTCFLPAKQLRAFERAPTPKLVRLLGGFDPYLQARDRDVIVPDTSVHKAMWPVLARPGAVFVDGEVVGSWRAKASGSKLTVAVSPFTRITNAAWADVESEAERVAAVRDLTLKSVTRGK